MRFKALFFSAFLSMTALAADYLSVPFTYGIPSTFKIENVDGMELRKDIYNNIDLSSAWSLGRLPGGHGYTAFSPTRSTDASRNEENRMVLPAITVSNVDAMLVWDAKSLHKNILESYRVDARCAGETEWKTIYDCTAENHKWTTRCVSLAEFIGNDVELAFVATTHQGFILAIDNIEVGVPKNQRFVFDNKTAHFVDNKGEKHFFGTLTNYGVTVNWNGVELVLDGNVVEQAEIKPLSSGEAVEIDFAISPEPGTHEYVISAIDGDKRIELCKDNIRCSFAKRTVLVDKCTGTWCNNCPRESLTTTELEDLYGDDMIIIENHINDAFANSGYNYTGDFVFGIPELVVNHNPITIGGTNTGDFINELNSPTIFGIEITAEKDASGVVKVHSNVTVAETTDNSSDRYRIGYVLLANLHTDKVDGNYVQQSQPSNYSWEQYYYMPQYILPEMMFYTNVPVDVRNSTSGISGSLASVLNANETYQHDQTLHIPAGLDMDTDFNVVALIIDSTTGLVQNCCKAGLSGSSAGIAGIAQDDDAPSVYYNLQGHRVTTPSNGIYIMRKGGKSRKIKK